MLISVPGGLKSSAVVGLLACLFLIISFLLYELRSRNVSLSSVYEFTKSYLHTRDFSAEYVFNKTTTASDKFNSIYFTVKTTRKFHQNRLDVQAKTWFNLVNNVLVITDGYDPNEDDKLPKTFTLVKTTCGSSYIAPDLCCKTGALYDAIHRKENLEWWCHFDDDNYVNPDLLLKYLKQFDWKLPHYIGRRSVDNLTLKYNSKPVTFEFAHGGCGACVSKGLVDRLEHWMGVEDLTQVCGQSFWINDDVAEGLIVTYLLNVPLKETSLLHSHREPMKDLNQDTLLQQVSLSYSKDNVISLDENLAKFNAKEDPTRLLSYHCLLYKNDPICS